MGVDANRSVALSIVAPEVRSRRTVTVGAAAGIAIVTVSSGLVLPTGITILVGIVGLAGIVVARASSASIRRALIARAARRERAKRRYTRSRALAEVNASVRAALAELVRFVDEIETIAPDIARRFELQDVLDRYVILAVAHERAIRATAMFDRAQIERTRDACRSDRAEHERRRELCERRLRCHDQCQARVEVLANELAMVADLIQLLAQRVACPDDPVLDDRIDRHLAELDEDDAARAQLAADLR